MLRLTHHCRNTPTTLTVPSIARGVLVRGRDSGGFTSSFGFSIPCDAHISKAATCSTNITGVDFRYFANKRSCRYLLQSSSCRKRLPNSNKHERIALVLTLARLVSLGNASSIARQVNVSGSSKVLRYSPNARYRQKSLARMVVSAALQLSRFHFAARAAKYRSFCGNGER